MVVEMPKDLIAMGGPFAESRPLFQEGVGYPPELDWAIPFEKPGITPTIQRQIHQMKDLDPAFETRRPMWRSKIFLVAAGLDHMRTLLCAGYPYILTSFWFIKNAVRKKWGNLSNFINFCGRRRQDFEIMIDSGSYSGAVHGHPIDLDDYIDFLYELEGDYDHYVNLDNQFFPRRGYNNWLYMCANGLPKAIHVHHRPEAFRWVEKIADECGDFTGLSPMPHATQSVKKAYFEVCHGLRPFKKWHWFGSVNIRLMKMFDVYSADSSAHDRTAATGIVYTPVGTFYFGNKPKDKERRHIYNQPPEVIAVVEEYLKNNLMHIEDVINKKYAVYRRSYLNVMWYRFLNERVNAEKDLGPVISPEVTRKTAAYHLSGKAPEGWK